MSDYPDEREALRLQDEYVILVKTSDLIKAGYGYLTSSGLAYTFVNKSWLKEFMPRGLHD
tara:strand:+ start:106 stop:285 length:180 start_codon:yes stop_codon:yes gene_type:complete